MKKLILFLSAILSLSFAKATVLTVSNNYLTAGQYTDLPAAYAAAAVGDTIYLHGSTIPYTGMSIEKRLTLIGAGYNDSSAFHLSTTLGSINIDTSTTLGYTVSGTKLIGLTIPILSIQGFSTSYPMRDIYISRCRIGYLGVTYVSLNKVSNIIMENNIIGALSLHSSGISGVIRNNLFTGEINGSNFSAPALIIDHNVIEGNVYSLQYAVISNNVFCYSNLSGYTADNYSHFSNNLAIHTSAVTWPTGTGIVLSGNISSNLPPYQFNNTVTSVQSYPALLSYDWHLASSSLGHNAATDGTDIGMYGGFSPMPNLTGTSDIIPQMTLMTILNPSIPVGTPINVHFKARRTN